MLLSLVHNDVRHVTIVAADGIIGALHGPRVGRCPDSVAFTEAGWLQRMQELNALRVWILRLFTDKGFALTEHVLRPFFIPRTPDEMAFNNFMSSIRIVWTTLHVVTFCRELNGDSGEFSTCFQV